jgi:hypothetical protein
MKNRPELQHAVPAEAYNLQEEIRATGWEEKVILPVS